jgi:diadenosine tetraphosphate (Ap4A) HIT family hydrolase
MIFEGRFWNVTRNSFNYQGAEHAFLIIYKWHVASLTETVRPESDIELMQIVRMLVQEFKIPGATLMMRFGDTDRTGASVTHLHAHHCVARV